MSRFSLVVEEWRTARVIDQGVKFERAPFFEHGGRSILRPQIRIGVPAIKVSLEQSETVQLVRLSMCSSSCHRLMHGSRLRRGDAFNGTHPIPDHNACAAISARDSRAQSAVLIARALRGVALIKR